MAFERTLGIIKPNATKKNIIGKIIDKYESEGFAFSKIEHTWITEAQAQEFYIEHKERPFYNDLVSFMTSGPVVLMVLERDNAIDWNRKVMGATNPEEAEPGTIRDLWGDDIEANTVHGSDSAESAEREVLFFYPEFAQTGKAAA